MAILALELEDASAEANPVSRDEDEPNPYQAAGTVSRAEDLLGVVRVFSRLELDWEASAGAGVMLEHGTYAKEHCARAAKLIAGGKADDFENAISVLREADDHACVVDSISKKSDLRDAPKIHDLIARVRSKLADAQMMCQACIDAQSAKSENSCEDDAERPKSGDEAGGSPSDVPVLCRNDEATAASTAEHEDPLAQDRELLEEVRKGEVDKGMVVWTRADSIKKELKSIDDLVRLEDEYAKDTLGLFTVGIHSQRALEHITSVFDAARGNDLELAAIEFPKFVRQLEAIRTTIEDHNCEQATDELKRRLKRLDRNHMIIDETLGMVPASQVDEEPDIELAESRNDAPESSPDDYDEVRKEEHQSLLPRVTVDGNDMIIRIKPGDHVVPIGSGEEAEFVRCCKEGIHSRLHETGEIVTDGWNCNIWLEKYCMVEAGVADEATSEAAS